MKKEYAYEDKAMGTDVSISIVGESKEVADALSSHALQTIHEYEARFSRFLKESELSVLNNLKQNDVSDTFLEVTEEAYRLFTLTRGVFNPLVQISRLGYRRSFDDPLFGTPEEDESPYDIDFSATVIDARNKKITLNEGQRLDFGGFLKGYLATLLCEEMRHHFPTVTGVIVNIGGDIHTYGLDQHEELFIFDIYNPVTQTEISVPVHNQSIATSGTYKRTWETSHKKVHHILDATGRDNPHTNIVSATVIHPQGSVAEAYAKVFLALGPTRALEVLPPEKITYLVIDTDGTVHTNI